MDRRKIFWLLKLLDLSHLLLAPLQSQPMQTRAITYSSCTELIRNLSRFPNEIGWNRQNHGLFWMSSRLWGRAIQAVPQLLVNQSQGREPSRIDLKNHLGPPGGIQNLLRDISSFQSTITLAIDNSNSSQQPPPATVDLLKHIYFSHGRDPKIGSRHLAYSHLTHKTSSMCRTHS